MLKPARSLAARCAPALAAALAAGLVVCGYVGKERTVYWWDFAGYQDLARQAAAAFAASKGFRFVYGTLGQSYNAVFAIPLVPILHWFGSSRIVYVLAVALLYHVPCALALGGIASRAIDAPRQQTFWLTTWIALLLPGLWLPVLRGFPDSAAALSFALAACCYLADPTLARRWQPPSIGALLAVSCVLRRHFLVGVPAFLAAMALVVFLERRAERKGVVRAALLSFWGTSLTAVAGVAFTALVAPPFAHLLANRDYHELYRSYMLPTARVASFLVEPYGVLVSAAAVVGLGVGLRSGLLHRGAGAFIALEGGLHALLWLLSVRQVGVQYGLHGAPAVATGLVALFWSLARRGRRMRVWAAAMPAYLALTFVSSQWAPLGVPTWLALALPAGGAPLVREDLDSLRALVGALRERCAGRPVFVVASSGTLNSDLLVRAERKFFGRADAQLDVLRTPEVDSRDRFPVTRLLNSGCAVVATPLQIHLERKEQDLISVADALFLEGAGVGRDFVRAPESFVLQGGVRAGIFRRFRPSPPEAGLETLRLFEKAIPVSAETQPDWVVLSRPFPAWVDGQQNGATTLVLHPAAPGSTPPALAVHRRRMEGRISIAGTVEFVDPRCAGAELRFSTLSQQADPLARVVRRPGSSGAFEVQVELPAGRRLSLLLTIPDGQPSIDYCLVRIDRLSVSPVRPLSSRPPTSLQHGQ